MINPLTLTPNHRDFWGDYNSHAILNLAPLCDAECFVPRYYHAPDNANESLAAGKHFQYNLVIPAGSFIWGFWHGVAVGFVLQITDVGMQHKFWNNPIPDSLLVNGLGSTLPNYPHLLCNPYPVVNPGVFIFEFWNPAQPGGAAVNAQITIGVAEVKKKAC